MKIGTLSKMTGFSASGIRFYEDTGLLTPQQARTGTYRTYSVSDAARLLDCRNLRECGCTMKETAEILCAPDAAEMAGRMEEYCDRLDERIRLEEKIEAHTRARALRLILRGKVSVELAERPGYYWCPLVPSAGKREKDFLALPGAEEGFPIPFADSTLLLACESARGGPVAAKATVGYGVERCYAGRFPTARGTVLVPACRCLHTYVTVNDDFSIDSAQLMPVYEAAEQAGLVLAGQALTHRIASAYHSNATCRYDEAWFPVEPA